MSVPYDRARDASNKGPLNPTQTAASHDYQTGTYFLGLGSGFLVGSTYPQIRSCCLAPNAPDSLYLRTQQLLRLPLEPLSFFLRCSLYQGSMPSLLFTCTNLQMSWLSLKPCGILSFLSLIVYEQQRAWRHLLPTTRVGPLSGCCHTSPDNYVARRANCLRHCSHTLGRRVIDIKTMLVVLAVVALGAFGCAAEEEKPLEKAEKEVGLEEIGVNQKISECMQQHDLPEQHSVFRGPSSEDPARPSQLVGETVKFAQCEWPPSEDAEADGYYEIEVTAVEGPGRSEAEGETVVDRISAPCQKLKMSYSFAQMDVRERRTFEATVDSIVTWEGEPWEGKVPEDLGFYPERGEFVVIRSLRSAADSIACVS